MQHIEMISAALGLLGAALLASRTRWAGWAFVAWLISNIGWIVFGAGNQHWFFITQQIGFTVTSLLGIWTWLVHPALRDAEQESTHYPRASVVINQCLDRDFVGLAMGSYVLHTTAPVTYLTLERIYLAGEEEGRALERCRAGAKENSRTPEREARHVGLDEDRSEKREQPATPGEAVKAFREYLRVHPAGALLSGWEKDEMALELARVALDFQGGAA